MRALFLTMALLVGSLGLVATTPTKADAEPRGWGWYSYDYGRPAYSRGGSRWRGGSWRDRSYYRGYYRPRYYGGYYGGYYYPRPYYYGSYYYVPGY